MFITATKESCRAHREQDLSCLLSWSWVEKEPSVFCFALWRPCDLFKKLVEYWLTVKGHIEREVFFSFFFFLNSLWLLCWESRSPLSSEDRGTIRARDFVMIVPRKHFLIQTCKEVHNVGFPPVYTHTLTVGIKVTWLNCFISIWADIPSNQWHLVLKAPIHGCFWNYKLFRVRFFFFLIFASVIQPK